MAAVVRWKGERGSSEHGRIGRGAGDPQRRPVAFSPSNWNSKIIAV
ncbi:MAG TPA: hypothetical protein VHZ54_02420 [Solirubrobacterales bacterium]|jgi:hypothetical protein|nr:hypothetical protein [Solirubrobacterales bacterium]